MTRIELVDYLLKQNYVQENRGLYSKVYEMAQGVGNVPGNLVTIQYRINKDILSVYYVLVHKKVKRFKAKIKNISIGSDNELIGLTIIK